MTDGGQRRMVAAALALVILVHCHNALPYLTMLPRVNVDEPWLMERAYQVITTGIPSQPMLRLERPYFLQVGYDYLYAPWFAAFGVGMFQARLLSVLLGLGTVLLVYGIGRRLAGAEAGLFAAAFLAADSNFLGNARTSRTDMPSVFFATAALWCFLRARDGGRPLVARRERRERRHRDAVPRQRVLGGADPGRVVPREVRRSGGAHVFPVSVRRRPAAHLRTVRGHRGGELGRSGDADWQLRRGSGAEPLAGHPAAACERRARSVSRLVLRPRHQHGAESVSPGVSGGHRRRVPVCALESRAAFAGSRVVRVSGDSECGHGRDLCRLHPEQSPRLHAEPAGRVRARRRDVCRGAGRVAAPPAASGAGGGDRAHGGLQRRERRVLRKVVPTQRKSELVPYQSTEGTLRALVPEGPKEVFASPNLWVPFHDQPGVRFVAYTGATPLVAAGSRHELQGFGLDRPIYLVIDESEWKTVATDPQDGYTDAWRDAWRRYITEQCVLRGVAYGTAFANLASFECRNGEPPSPAEPIIVGGRERLRIDAPVWAPTDEEVTRLPRYEDSRKSAGAPAPRVEIEADAVRISGTQWPGLETHLPVTPGQRYLVTFEADEAEPGDLLFLGRWDKPEVLTLSGSGSAGFFASLATTPWFPSDRAFVATSDHVTLRVYSEMPSADFKLRTLKVYRLVPAT